MSEQARHAVQALAQIPNPADDHLEHVRQVLIRSLNLGRLRLERDTPLLGSLPELDSMAVAGLLTALEQHFGIAIDDDDISARHFATLGTLSDFVQAKLA